MCVCTSINTYLSHTHTHAHTQYICTHIHTHVQTTAFQLCKFPAPPLGGTAAAGSAGQGALARLGREIEALASAPLALRARGAGTPRSAPHGEEGGGSDVPATSTSRRLAQKPQNEAPGEPVAAARAPPASTRGPTTPREAGVASETPRPQPGVSSIGAAGLTPLTSIVAKCVAHVCVCVCVCVCVHGRVLEILSYKIKSKVSYFFPRIVVIVPFSKVVSSDFDEV